MALITPQTNVATRLAIQKSKAAIFNGLTVNGLLYYGEGRIKSLAAATDGQLPIGSTGAAPVLATLTGTANQVNIANAAGAITLSTPQDIHTAAIPTFAGAILSGTTAIGLDMSGGTFTYIQKWPAGTISTAGTTIFQPAADSTTAYQWLDADGGTPVLNIDTTNERVGIRTPTPIAALDIGGYGNPNVIKIGGFQLGLIADYNNIMGMEIKNTNTGTLADQRIAVVDTNGEYLAFSMPGVNYSGSLFGAQRNTTAYLFAVGATRNLTLGTVGNTDIIFGTTSTERVRILKSTGYVGFGGETAPETLTEWTHAQPDLTLHCSTHQDTDGGRRSRLIAKGEQGVSPFEEGTLGMQEWSHDGTGEDFGGKWVLSTHTKAEAGADTLVAAIAVDSFQNTILPKTSGVGIKVDLAAPTFGFADLLGDQFSKNTGGTKPTLVAYNGAVDAWQFSDGDEAFLTYHIPHDYVAGTDIHLHIHWSQIADNATGGTVDFKYFAIYAKGHNQASGSVFTGFNGNPITATFSSIDIDDSGAGLTQYQQHLTEVIISGASATEALFDRDDFEPDGVIELTLEMDANNLTFVTGSTDPFIHYADIHYQTTGLIGTKSRTPDFYV